MNANAYLFGWLIGFFSVVTTPLMAQEEKYDPMRALHEVWISTPGASVVDEYVFSFEEDSGRRVTQTGDLRLTTRIAIRRNGELQDFSYFALLDGSFEDWLGARNAEVAPEDFEAEIQTFFGSDGGNWRNLRHFAFWNYERGSRSPTTQLIAVQSRDRETLAICDDIETSRDSVAVSLFHDVRGGCRLYTQAEMLDHKLSTTTVIEAVDFFSRRRGPYGLIAGDVGFSDGMIIIEGFRRPERTVSSSGGFQGWDHWMRLTQGSSTGLGPRISCRIDGGNVSRFTSLSAGSLLMVSVRLIEVSGGQFVFECS